jgi:hypothetical protein
VVELAKGSLAARDEQLDARGVKPPGRGPAKPFLLGIERTPDIAAPRFAMISASSIPDDRVVAGR